ncbi:arylesterase [Robiginitalea sp.]|nr:arylesterase [Robiginitalea sp.]
MGVTPEESFPGQIAQRLDSLGYPYRVINAGLSGETTASGMNRLNWVLREKPDVFILELGANDGLRGIALEETKKNLEQIVKEVKNANPEVNLILTGMQIPPNMGPEYTEKFKNLFPELAEAHDLLLVPFLLDGVGGIPELNQADGIHPTPKGHQILAENVWQVLFPVLQNADSDIH